jgi:hypothetical protein
MMRSAPTPIGTPPGPSGSKGDGRSLEPSNITPAPRTMIASPKMLSDLREAGVIIAILGSFPTFLYHI